MSNLPESQYGYDILNAICDLGGIAPRPRSAKYKGGEYDDMPRIKGVYVRIMSGRSAPDQIAAQLKEQNFGDGTVVTMWAMVHQAMRRRIECREESEHQRKNERETLLQDMVLDPAPF